MRLKAQPGFLTLLCLLFLSPGPVWADSPSDFSLGVSASKQGQFEVAIGHFLKAEKNGKRSAALYHNLGVAYFKTGNYDAASSAFLKVSESSKLAALGFYNLGLVEEKRNNKAQAKRWFAKARSSARTEKLKRLVDVKLGRRQDSSVPYIAFLEVAAGSDSNPQLADETNETVEKEADSFLGAIAYGRYHFSGSAQEGSYISGTAYLRRYGSADEDDIKSLNLGGGYVQNAGRWKFDYQLAANQLSLGGEEIQDGVVGTFLSRRRLAAASYLDVRLSVEDVTGDEANGYDYLSGNRYQLRLRYGDTVGVVNWSVRYEASLDDRGELINRSTDGSIVDRYSASPTRHEIRLDMLTPLSPSIDSEFTVGFRRSDFKDDEIRASTNQGVRRDDRSYASLGLIYRFASGWMAKCEASYWDNASNFDSYDYQRRELALSVSRSFY